MARYKTGQQAPRTATYTFDGYVEPASAPPPTAEEMKIPLTLGDTFPPIRSTDRAAYWRG